MGTAIQSYTLDKKLKTVENVRKWYKDAVKQDQFENGHNGYTGTIGSTHGLKFTGRSVELIEDLEAMAGRTEKGDVEVYTVKVINENMATLVKWREEVGRLYGLVQSSDRASRLYPDSYEVHLDVKKRAEKDLVRARKRYLELRRNAAARSKKFQYAVIAACPE